MDSDTKCIESTSLVGTTPPTEGLVVRYERLVLRQIDLSPTLCWLEHTRYE